MTRFHDLSAELLWIIVDFYVPQDWNAQEDFEGYLDSRLVCKTFDSLISSHLYKKLEWVYLIERLDLLLTDTVSWLLHQGILAELKKDPENDQFSSLSQAPLHLLSSDNKDVILSKGGRYLQAACNVAAAYQGAGLTIDQLDREELMELWQPTGSSMLAVAAYYGDETLVMSLVQQGVVLDVNSCDRFLGPALYAAVYGGKISIARFLISNGADCEVNGSLGSALHVAVKNEDVQMVKLLLEQAELDPNAIDANDTTPLSTASAQGNVEIVRLLLDHDDIDVAESYPVTTAVENNQETVLRMLLAAGAGFAGDNKRGLGRGTEKSEDMDVDQESDTDTETEEVTEPEMEEMDAEWEDKTDVEMEEEEDLETESDQTSEIELDEEQVNSALWAALYNDVEPRLLEILLDSWKIKAGEYFHSSQTLLWWTVDLGNIPALEVLLKRNDVDPNTTGASGDTPLWNAAEHGYHEMVDLLLQQPDIRPGIENHTRGTALHVAAKDGHNKIVQMLLARDDVDCNALGCDGETPLWLAASNGHADIVHLLLQKPEINANSKSKSGDSPLCIAAAGGHKGVVQALMECETVNSNLQGKGNRSPLIFAVESGVQHSVYALICRLSTDVNLADSFGRTPAHVACEKGDDAMLQLLLQRPDIKLAIYDQASQTPLITAAKEGYAGVVQLILDHQPALIDMQDDNGDTSLMHAVLAGHFDVVRLLINYGANVRVTAANGLTALQYARNRSNRMIDNLLRRAAGFTKWQF